MTHKPSSFWMIALLVLPLALLLGACSDDDDDKITDPTPTNGACCLPDGSCEVMAEADCVADEGLWQGGGTVCDPDPCQDDGVVPVLPGIGIVRNVDFNSVDPNALEAKAILQGQLDAMAMIVGFVDVLIDPISAAEWVFQGSGCYRWILTEDECTSTFTVCMGEEGMDWTILFDGPCYPDTEPFENWLGVRGWSNVAGTEGWFNVHAPGTEMVILSWTWDAPEDGKSGTWVFYQGSRVPENRIAEIIWEEDEDGSQDIEWIMYAGMNRGTMDVVADGTEGEASFYTWDAEESEWVSARIIIWYSNGTGSHNYYEDGNWILVGW